MRFDVPHYRQTTEYTCGPACVMMVLKFFNKDIEFSKRSEFDIWRECNMIGALGADVFSLSLPLIKRGLKVKILTERKETIPIRRIVQKWGEERGRIAKYVMQLSYEKVRSAGMKIVFRSPKVDDVREALAEGTLPIVLVNLYEMHRYNIPHWVVVTGFDSGYVYLNDPLKRKGGYRVKEDVFIRSMGRLAAKIGVSRSLLKAWQSYSCNYLANQVLGSSKLMS
ncbi:MAG: hypothetical protein HA494_04060 [Thaumarchaeota archaeon]|nr:hypothetical protein [Nitrososphaerota archaeon]